ncbi:hypothetical protein [Actinoplanes sp. NBRC 101535]|uniref:hypothetical protein n=1 Tax=Actinoplanes sp. NBRC 101535 TaxID=3032196 RepID=UPI0024A067D2|nr:hypothetical protein [Actinoplanes sp. NBRC 101535]GLY01489.1 hypothetical protein Acsp01_18680 [Actinoplanes sp. NBRC 101535]
MTRTVRSSRAESAYQPLYARTLRLRHLAPSGLLCFVFLEGTIVLGILLALAELVSWWGVLVLPITVALMVKFNDMVAGSLTRRYAQTASARASVRGGGFPGFPEQATVEAPAVGGPRVTFEGMTGPVGPMQQPAAWVPEASRSTARATAAAPGAVAYGSPAGDPGSAAAGVGTAAAGSGHGAGHAAAGSGHGVGHAGAGVEGGAPRRGWADEVDVRRQMARQAAVRRYE